MAIFNWEYLSLITHDQTWFYREMVAIPIIILILWFYWMKVVKSAMKDDKQQEGIDIAEAYQDAILNERSSSDEDEDHEDGTKSADNESKKDN